MKTRGHACSLDNVITTTRYCPTPSEAKYGARSPHTSGHLFLRSRPATPPPLTPPFTCSQTSGPHCGFLYRKYFPSLSDSGEGRCSERREKRRTMWNCCYMMEEASDAHAEATEQLDEYGLWLSRPHYKTLGILMCDQRVAPASAGVPLAKAFAHEILQI